MIDREASRLTTGNWRLATADCRLPTDFGEQVDENVIRCTFHVPRRTSTGYRQLATADCRLLTADCRLPTDFPKRVESLKLLRMLRICMGLIPALLWGLLSFGAQGNKDADLAREIEDNLIAPCCWSQPVSQHYSEAAEQIRTEVRAMVAEGMTRDEILDHYVAIYGERILAAPRAKGFNMLAYVLPWAALAFGAWLLIVLVKKLRSPAPSPGPVDVPYARYASRIEKELKEFEE